MPNRKTLLINWYEAMLRELGPSNWWPAETPFETALGAILTQNTSWTNVERAMDVLRAEDLLHPERLYALAQDELAERIRPAGYFRLKAKRLRNFLRFLRDECGFEIGCLKEQDMEELRPKLLAVNGIGPETADAILLYALDKPSFVVDAYTMRVVNRHGLLPEDAGYEELRALFMDVLPRDTALYNEYHALIVRTAKPWCKKKKPLCEECPLGEFLD